jgi:hypothetical protein
MLLKANTTVDEAERKAAPAGRQAAGRGGRRHHPDVRPSGAGAARRCTGYTPRAQNFNLNFEN